MPAARVVRCLADGAYFTAGAGAQGIGFLRCSLLWGAVPFMEMAWVDPGHRRRGVGAALLAAWEQAMRAKGAAVLMTSSVEEEAEPQAWHQHNGFRRSGTLSLGRHQAVPEVFFLKDL